MQWGVSLPYRRGSQAEDLPGGRVEDLLRDHRPETLQRNILPSDKQAANWIILLSRFYLNEGPPTLIPCLCFGWWEVGTSRMLVASIYGFTHLWVEEGLYLWKISGNEISWCCRGFINLWIHNATKMCPCLSRWRNYLIKKNKGLVILIGFFYLSFSIKEFKSLIENLGRRRGTLLQDLHREEVEAERGVTSDNFHYQILSNIYEK